ncbi:Maleylacetoacetate isomerase @ Glutathione S-transferase, zeta, partial [hydrothermal vent metagenome]
HWMKRGFDALEIQAPETGLFGGDAPNLADICLIPQLYNARRFGMDLVDYPKLLRIDAECAALEAFKKSTPEMAKEMA